MTTRNDWCKIGRLALEWSLLQLQQDGAHASNILGVSGALGVELAQPADAFPLVARQHLIPVMDERRLSFPVRLTRTCIVSIYKQDILEETVRHLPGRVMLHRQIYAP